MVVVVVPIPVTTLQSVLPIVQCTLPSVVVLVDYFHTTIEFPFDFCFNNHYEPLYFLNPQQRIPVMRRQHTTPNVLGPKPFPKPNQRNVFSKFGTIVVTKTMTTIGTRGGSSIRPLVNTTLVKHVSTTQTFDISFVFFVKRL